MTAAVLQRLGVGENIGMGSKVVVMFERSKLVNRLNCL